MFLSVLFIGSETVFAETHAFYLETIPAGYESQATFVASVQASGANTLMVDMPVTPGGSPDYTTLYNIVFLAHHAGLKLYVMLPTRRVSSDILSRHPDWEDMEYVPATGAMRQTGTLDLFNGETVEYLAAFAGEVASYSVDGILLRGDFSYGPFEGMSRNAMKAAEKHLGYSIRPGKLYERIGDRQTGPVVEQAREAFKPWTEMKSGRLLEAFDAIRKAVSASGKNTRIGASIPISYPIANSSELMARYSLDVNAMKKREVDHFWAVIHLGGEESAGKESYRRTLEGVSRSAQSVMTTIRDHQRTLLLVSVKTADGKMLPLSEIEEASALLQQAGVSSFGYILSPITPLPPVFTQKMFRTNGEKNPDR